MATMGNSTTTPQLPSSFPGHFLNTVYSEPRYNQLAYHLAIYAHLLYQFIPPYLHPVKGPRHARAFGHRFTPLATHIVLSLIIVIRFQYRILTAPASLYPHAGPVADRIDLLLGLVNAVISWGLCRKLGKGNPNIQRTAFQSFALHVGFCSIMAYWTGSPGWMDAMVKDHNAFAHVRWILLIDGKVKFCANFGEAYTVGFFTGLLVSVAEGKSPAGGGLPAFLFGMVLLKLVEGWISGKITPKNATTSPFFRLALFIGLVEYRTYKMLRGADAEDATDENGSGLLKAE